MSAGGTACAVVDDGLNVDAVTIAFAFIIVCCDCMLLLCTVIALFCVLSSAVIVTMLCSAVVCYDCENEGCEDRL